MNETPLQICMLGEFSISSGGNRIDAEGKRSRKAWLLLAYMIYHRSRAIPPNELISLLWGETENSSNPTNALKTLLHRVRSMLNQLAPDAGHTLILRRDGGYTWNTSLPFSLDIERFDLLCAQAAASPAEERVPLLIEALSLYRGDFLSVLSTEPWVVPIATHYHNIYLQVLLDTLPILEAQGQWTHAAALCRSALQVEPYSETLCQHLMRALMETGDQQGAVQAYEEMSELLFSNFSVMPSDESRALYREALRTVNDRALPISLIQEQLREQDAAPGALICDYDFFKVLYHAEARAVARNGYAVHIALLTLTGADDKPLPKRSLDRAMENLQKQIRTNLRRGDIAAPCSVSQFIIMLPQANYENSCMVCRRICTAFARQYPHSPAVIHFSVQPLEPNP